MCYDLGGYSIISRMWRNYIAGWSSTVTNTHYLSEKKTSSQILVYRSCCTRLKRERKPPGKEDRNTGQYGEESKTLSKSDCIASNTLPDHLNLFNWLSWQIQYNYLVNPYKKGCSFLLPSQIKNSENDATTICFFFYNSCVARILSVLNCSRE